jgi:hypothetical protein
MLVALQDQISASHAESCYEGGRGGGGSAWSAGNRAVLKSALEAGKRAHGGTAIVLSSESMNEQYISQIGVNLGELNSNCYCLHNVKHRGPYNPT